ncbi:hypothetical protein Pst134EA_003090 [Puccinia striiformis f. sp. tritici]|nr:hypothetical protein Pst134EA_003090 [Puccinia striiformis f. sp. tritici]KAH9472480.1 hypothetical protein Pst134EA_003090 [Puccinia striiformis f. sp. tritici]
MFEPNRKLSATKKAALARKEREAKKKQLGSSGSIEAHSATEELDSSAKQITNKIPQAQCVHQSLRQPPIFAPQQRHGDLVANPEQVNEFNPPTSPPFHNPNNTTMPTQSLPANTSTPISQDTTGTLSNIVNTPIANMNFDQLLSFLASSNNVGLLNPTHGLGLDPLAAQLTPYPITAHLGQHLNLPVSSAINASPQTGSGETMSSPAPSDTTHSIEDYL